MQHKALGAAARFPIKTYILRWVNMNLSKIENGLMLLRRPWHRPRVSLKEARKVKPMIIQLRHLNAGPHRDVESRKIITREAIRIILLCSPVSPGESTLGRNQTAASVQRLGHHRIPLQERAAYKKAATAPTTAKRPTPAWAAAPVNSEVAGLVLEGVAAVGWGTVPLPADG